MSSSLHHLTLLQSLEDLDDDMVVNAGRDKTPSSSSDSSQNSFLNQPHTTIDIDLSNSVHIEAIHTESTLLDDLHNSEQVDVNIGFERARSNSPLTISNYDGSRSGSGSDSDSNQPNMNEPFHLVHSHFKKLTYRDTEKLLQKYYDISLDNKYSTEIDILTTYIRAQKNLYIQSKHITQRKLNGLMFPTLILSAFITMIAPFIECMHWSGGFISGLNAIIMLCISVVNYLQLESSIEKYMQNAKQYDKMETMLEMTNNKILFIESDKEKNTLVLDKIKEIEKRIDDIKESTNILIPDQVKSQFPIVCHINIFSVIKKIEIYKKNLISKFRDVKNEIRYIVYKMEKSKLDAIENNRNMNRLHFLYNIKDKLKVEFLEFQNTYSYIDSIFAKEIKRAETQKCSWFWRTNDDSFYKKGGNPIIDKYFQFMFADE
jgi:hypothetical protein